MLISVDPAGLIRMIYTDDMAALLSEGQSSITRASHVEPCGAGWSADLSPVGGPTLGPSPLRSDALSAEVEWLETNYL